MAFLEDVEWGGDFVTGVVIVAIGAALVWFGFVARRLWAPVLVAVVPTVAAIASDVLYFGFDVDLIGYCGDVACEPSPCESPCEPIPVSFALFLVPPAVLLTWLGVVIRRRAAAADRLLRQ